VLKNSLFVARQGEGLHGKVFIKEAEKKGASASLAIKKLKKK